MNGEIRVLHVDNDPEFADVAAAVLEREDDRLSVETAPSARSGLERLARTEFDCVIADYDMPDRDGIDFLTEVREESPDLPFVLFTGKGDEDVASDAISAGVSDYLQKGGTDQFAVLANRVTNLVEKYRAEQARHRYQRLVEAATDVILVVGTDGTIRFATPSAESILGRSPEDLVGTSPFESIHPEDLADVRGEFEALVDHPDEERTAEFRYERPDGSEVWIETRGRNLVEDPVIDGIVIYARAVTERVERERDLQRYETIVENTEDGIYVWDADARFEFVNQRAVDVSGIPYDAWIGEHVSVLADLGAMTDRQVRRVEGHIDAIVRGDSEGARIEVTPDIPHDLQVLELRLTPFLPESGDDRVIGFTRDITERTEYERQLEQKNDRLEEFSRVVGHDLRNPLTVAEGHLELARTTGDPDHFEKVAGAHDRIRDLIDDLLAEAREGEAAMTVETVDLAGLAETCWETVDTGSATLAVETDRSVRADRGRLQQLLENLIRNAVTHGGADVTVTVGDLEGGFYVADDGPGIPADVRESVFEAGYSTDETGTGLGLAIVADVVDAHDWAVDVTDGADGGARFEVTGVEDGTD